MPMRWHISLLLLAVVVLLPASAKAQSVEDFYRGKTLSMVIGYPTGGANDRYARTIARHIGKHIPGHPSVIARNMPGGGSLIAANHLFHVAPRDGSMLGLLATMPSLTSGGVPNLSGGGLPNLGSLPSLTNLAGCVPMNIPACITSISASAGTGTAPKLDLSTCMPVALPTTGLPGTGSLPGLSTLTGLTGALPFLGK